MYRLIIFGPIVFLVVFFMSLPQLFAADLAQDKVRAEYLILQKKLKNEKSIQVKLQQIKKFAEYIKIESAKEKKQNPEVGIWFDMLNGSLESFPHNQKFALKDCKKYKNKLHVQYEPMTVKSGYEPVQISEYILISLCGDN